MPITHVIKREGKLQPFERERVVNSIFRAAEAAGGKDRQLAEKRATEVIELLEQKFADRPPHVEDVQDAIERVLVERRHYRTAKLFMLYRKRHEELRAARSVVFDAGKLIDDFVSRNDWRSAENANISYSLPALMFHNTGSVTARYCFDEKTRVLTEKGFKHFKDVQPGDKVATLNLENGELEFQHPTSRQVFYYQGHMFHWKMKKGGTDLLVTPEHRMLVRFSPRGKWRFVSAAELARKNRYEFKRSAGWQGISMQLDVSPVGKSRFYKPHLISKYEQAKSLKKSGLGSERIGRILGVAPWTVSAWLYQNHNPNRIGGEPKNLKFPIDDFIELIGWFISEGTLWSDGKSDHRVEIAQEKKKNRKKIEGLLRRLGLTAYAGKSRFRVTSKQLYNYFLRFGKVSKERCIPKDIKSLPPKYLDLILHTLFLGDGNFRNGKMKQYVSKSKRLVEDIAECLVKTGRGAKIFWDRKCWVVGVGNKTQTPEFVGKPAIVPYEGWVYDLTVPSGTLLVEREGCIQWSGNCLDRVYGPEISDSHISGDLHLHDLYNGLNGYCFDEKTRVLTEDGFKYFKDVAPEDKVATLNLERNELKFQHPIDKQVFHCEGKLFHWRSKLVDLLVTPEHRMLAKKYRWRRRRRRPLQSERKDILSKYEKAMQLKREGLGPIKISRIVGTPVGTVQEWIYHGRKPRTRSHGIPWRFVKASELASWKACNFKKDAKWRGRNPERFKVGGGQFPIKDFLEFLGWYIAEGNSCVDKGGYKIAISQCDRANQERIADVMRRIGLRPRISEYHVEAYSKPLYPYLKGLGNAKEKFIPKEIKELDPSLIQVFLLSLFAGDGRFRKGRLAYYYTQSDRLAEDVVECLVKTGRSASLHVNKEGEYSISVNQEQLNPQFTKKPELVEYRGLVYDLTVPNGTLLVERNGKVVWSGNCADWSLQQLLLKGFGGIPGGVRSKPPTHLDTALMQMVNFIGSLQNEWAGAQAFNACDVLLAPFVRADELDYRQTKQAIQALVFNLNITSRWGGQTPFTNLTFSLSCPEDLAGQPAVVGGKPLDRTYAEYEPEVEMLNRAFIEVLCEGDASGRPFTFPIPTYSLTRDFEWEEGISRELFAMTGKLGLPYFQNFVSSELSPSQARSMCCHLRLDLEELRRNVTGGLFGSADQTGSVGVVTVNMPRLGYLAKDEDEFFERLGYLLMLASRSLEHKRRIVERNIRSGLLPLTKRYLGSLRNHFSTIGLVGMHEALLNFGIEGGICSAEGRDFARRVLTFMRERCAGFQRETGNLYNLEATPAEGTSYRLARIDKRKYPDIRTAGGKIPYYTNSTNLPAAHGLSLVEALEHQEPLQQIYTGGTVFHCFLGEAVMDPGGCELLVRRIAENFRIPYFTITPIFSICPDHGYLTGNRAQCPTCGKKTEVYSRVVGYFRPVRNWNAGKREEFKERSSFDRTLHGVAR